MVKKFDKEFKLEAVKMVLEQNRKPTEVAYDLGLHPNTVYRWLQEFDARGVEAFPGSGHLHPEDDELRRLKRRIADLEEENAILKKATAIFAKHQK